MSKKTADTKVSDNHEMEKIDFKGTTEEELKEIVEVLKNQALQHQTMAVKAQGALEVVLQMLPKEDNSEG